MMMLYGVGSEPVDVCVRKFIAQQMLVPAREQTARQANPALPRRAQRSKGFEN
jgi:hypothetical protein